MGREIIRGVKASVSSRPRCRWVAPALLPVINLALALLLSAVVVVLIGESPTRALWLLANGAVGNAEAVGYTLYYATNFVFTGLAVAVPFTVGCSTSARRVRLTSAVSASRCSVSGPEAGRRR